MTDELRTLIGEKIGEATMCWQPIPSGVFDSQRAGKILDEIYEAIDRHYHQKFLEIIGEDEPLKKADDFQKRSLEIRRNELRAEQRQQAKLKLLGDE